MRLWKREKCTKIGLTKGDTFYLGDTGFTCTVDVITDKYVFIRIPTTSLILKSENKDKDDQNFLEFQLTIGQTKKLQHVTKTGLQIDFTLEDIFEVIVRNYV